MRGRSLEVILVDTNPEGQSGSMAVYCMLVKDALSLSKNASALSIVCMRLALPRRILDLLPERLQNWAHHAWIMFFGRIRLIGYKADIVHILDGSHAYVAKWLTGTGIVATSHDVIPLLQQQGFFHDSRPKRTASWLISRSLDGIRKADCVIAVSRNTEYDLVRCAGVKPENVRVIYSAIPERMSDKNGHLPSWRDRRSREDAYILHVGNNAFYKNRAGVVRIFGIILQKCRIRLVMAGPEPTDELRSTVDARGLSGAMEFVSNPDQKTLQDLYRNACLFLFPSLYEGFGWPPLEAMSCGCPVVCSDAASLPEVVGEAALTFPPSDEAKAAHNCVAILSDEKLAVSLVEKGSAQASKFTLERMGRELVSAYEYTLKDRLAVRRPG